MVSPTLADSFYVDPNCRQRFMEQIAAEGAVLGFEAEVYRQDGSRIWIAESTRAGARCPGHHHWVRGHGLEDITQTQAEGKPKFCIEIGSCGGWPRPAISC